MAKPIYFLFLGKFTEAWYQLSQEEQDSLTAKVGEAFEKADGKRVVVCDSSWSSEQWGFFGLNEFPDIEAVQKNAELLNELDWFRYVDTMSVMGTEWPPS
jgi:hypothetical protein